METLDGNELYDRYGVYISKFSGKLARNMRCPELDAEEVEQIAWEAALRCFSRYTGFNKQGEKVKFETYAAHRIKGSILDEIRKRGYLSTMDGERRTYLPKLTDHIEELTFGERASILSTPEVLEDIGFSSESLESILAHLKNEREKYVLRMKYIYEISLVQIGLTLGVSASRVSQLEKKGLEKLCEASTKLGGGW